MHHYLICLLVSLCCGFTSSDDLINIVINKNNTSNFPRTSEIVPMNCVYFNGTVFINFTENIGETFISITNFSSGETVYEEADSADGQACIQTSGESGEYMLLIETEYGESYEGTFLIE